VLVTAAALWLLGHVAALRLLWVVKRL